jgi:hypothetical protein
VANPSTLQTATRWATRISRSRPPGRPAFRVGSGWHIVIVVLCGALLGGCGGTRSASAGSVASQYARDVLRGNGTDACLLLTPASRRATDAMLAVMDAPRFIQRSLGTTCADYFSRIARASLAPSDAIPTLTSVRGITTSGDRAIVTFVRPRRNAGVFAVAMGGPHSTQIQLARMDGQWRVIGEGNESRQQLISDADASPTCIAAWNHVARSGLVELPALAGLHSEQIWASLSYGGTPCAMTIETPRALEQYVEHPNGSWSRFPSGAYSFAQPALSRSVWLDRIGLATPASQKSPDGIVPALVGAVQARVRTVTAAAHLAGARLSGLAGDQDSTRWPRDGREQTRQR